MFTAQYNATEISVRFLFVIPAKLVPAGFRPGAGIREAFLDSGQSLSPQALGGEHAGMTRCDNRRQKTEDRRQKAEDGMQNEKQAAVLSVDSGMPSPVVAGKC